MGRAICLFLLLSAGLAGEGLVERIQRVLDDATKLKRGYIGIEVVDLATGTILYPAATPTSTACRPQTPSCSQTRWH